MKNLIVKMMGGKQKVIKNVVYHEYDVSENKLMYQQLVPVKGKFKDGKTTNGTISLTNVWSFEVVGGAYAAI